jgi:hypothetical protein
MTVKEAAPRYGRINQPSLGDRLDQGKAVRSGRLEAVEGV